jgi:solute carrier family 25 2-oxodicarboxylate transporter 21
VPVPGQDHYTGMLDCIKKIVKNEGYVRSWYTGRWTWS